MFQQSFACGILCIFCDGILHINQHEDRGIIVGMCYLPGNLCFTLWWPQGSCPPADIRALHKGMMGRYCHPPTVHDGSHAGETLQGVVLAGHGGVRACYQGLDITGHYPGCRGPLPVGRYYRILQSYTIINNQIQVISFAPIVSLFPVYFPWSETLLRWMFMDLYFTVTICCLPLWPLAVSCRSSFCV